MFFIIIRGPAAVGKSTIAKELSEILKAKHMGFDKVMKKHKLDIIEKDGISTKNFIKANNLILDKAIKYLKKKKIVIFDGCFYRKKQIQHLLKNLSYKSYIFSLKAPVDVCLERNKSRDKNMSDKDIYEVYDLVYKYEYGIIIDTYNKTKEQIIEEILSYLPNSH